VNIAPNQILVAPSFYVTSAILFLSPVLLSFLGTSLTPVKVLITPLGKNLNLVCNRNLTVRNLRKTTEDLTEPWKLVYNGVLGLIFLLKFHLDLSVDFG